MRGAGPLRGGEFERGIPLSCCRPGKALFSPYNSVLYKKGRPHRPVMNTGGRPGANRPGFSRFAFCIRSSYTVGAPPAISRRNGPRVIKSARAGNAVDVPPVPLCTPFGGRITDTGQDRPSHRSGDQHKNGTRTGHMAGASPGCALTALYECRLLSLKVARGGCGGLPPPGKGPSPAVWGEGLYRLPLDVGVQVSRPATRAQAGLLAAGLQGPAGVEGSKGSLYRPPVPSYVAGPGGDRNGGLCGDTWGCVCPSAHGATGSKYSAASPAISCAPRVR